MKTTPLSPESEDPVYTLMLPVLPLLAVPVNKKALPEDPLEVASSVSKLKLPELLDPPAPVRKAIEPPVLLVDVVEPATIITEPPLALLVVPTSTDTPPATPPVEAPVPISTYPLLPMLDVPVLSKAYPLLPLVAAPL